MRAIILLVKLRREASPSPLDKTEQDGGLGKRIRSLHAAIPFVWIHPQQASNELTTRQSTKAQLEYKQIEIENNIQLPLDTVRCCR